MTLEELRNYKKEYFFEAFLEIPNERPNWERSSVFKQLTKEEQYFVNDQFEKRLIPYMDQYYLDTYGCKTDRTTAGVEHDAVLTTAKGTKFTVEEKYRTFDYEDLLVEIMQDAARYPFDFKQLGWFYNEKAHRLVYVVCRDFADLEPRKIYTVDMVALRRNLNSLLLQGLNATPKISKKGRGFTINLCIPWKNLLELNFPGQPTIVTETILKGGDTYGYKKRSDSRF